MAHFDYPDVAPESYQNVQDTPKQGLKDPNAGYATKADLETLKEQVNNSFQEIIEMLVGMQNDKEAFEARIAQFNKRSGTKL